MTSIAALLVLCRLLISSMNKVMTSLQEVIFFLYCVTGQIISLSFKVRKLPYATELPEYF